MTIVPKVGATGLMPQMYSLRWSLQVLEAKVRYDDHRLQVRRTGCTRRTLVE